MIVITAAKMLLIYVDEADRDGDMPLYEVIVRRLIQSNVKGASVHAGIMGFGTHHRIHQKGLLGISDDRPVTITAADKESVLREILPDLRLMIREGTIALMDVELVEDQQ